MNINRLFVPVFLLGIGVVFYFSQKRVPVSGELRDATAAIATAPDTLAAPPLVEMKAQAASAARARPTKARLKKRHRVNYQLGNDRHEPTGAELLETVYTNRAANR